ncbi:MAG: hypothetical protein LWY06_18905 [Firmicutes bacterium]|nr:hypothetical protein [Bacillota bacterium]
MKKIYPVTFTDPKNAHFTKIGGSTIIEFSPDKSSFMDSQTSWLSISLIVGAPIAFIFILNIFRSTSGGCFSVFPLIVGGSWLFYFLSYFNNILNYTNGKKKIIITGEILEISEGNRLWTKKEVYHKENVESFIIGQRKQPAAPGTLDGWLNALTDMELYNPEKDFIMSFVHNGKKIIISMADDEKSLAGLKNHLMKTGFFDKKAKATVDKIDKTGEIDENDDIIKAPDDIL